MVGEGLTRGRGKKAAPQIPAKTPLSGASAVNRTDHRKSTATR
jgi:hypothetical protein